MANFLEQLKTMTTVVVDSGDINLIKTHQPEDATTNPSLLLKAASMPDYQYLVEKSVADAKKTAADDVVAISDQLAVNFGCEILQHIPGRVSTEVDARLSFDTRATLNKARKLMALYQNRGVAADRILIKIAATWEGIQAAKILEQENIQCNLTLVFSFGQAVACGNAGVYLISPFVGRILDWYKANSDRQNMEGPNDPGVQSVTRIYQYYKQMGINTVVMGASFRNLGQIESLAGCDRLTISPDLLEALSLKQGTLERRLAPSADSDQQNPLQLDENKFRWELNQDAMASEKLAEGIRKFAADQVALESLIKTIIDRS